MRTSLDNPFTPDADTVPAVWAGRIPQLSDWRDIVRPRKSAGSDERARVFLGEPGLGKSTLVRRIVEDATRQGDWATRQIRIPKGGDPLKLLAAELLIIADTAGLSARSEKSLKELLGRVEEVKVSGTGVTLREKAGEEAHVALTALLVELGRASLRHQNVTIVHLDEVQNITDEGALSQLLVAIGDANAHQVEIQAPGGALVSSHLPLAFYLTGLPEFEDRAANSAGATFGRRFERKILEPLDDADLQDALRGFVTHGWPVVDDAGRPTTVTMTETAALRIGQLSQGEPFLFQLAGQQAWYAGSSAQITEPEVLAGWERVADEARDHVERILEALPVREREVLEAMAKLPAQERTADKIAVAAGYASSTQIGTTARRLHRVRGIIRRGKPYVFVHRAIEAYLTSEWPDV